MLGTVVFHAWDPHGRLRAFMAAIPALFSTQPTAGVICFVCALFFLHGATPRRGMWSFASLWRHSALCALVFVCVAKWNAALPFIAIATTFVSARRVARVAARLCVVVVLTTRSPPVR